MQAASIILLTCFSAVLAAPERIVGGNVTTINQWPFMAAVLYSPNAVTYSQHCGGTILNYRSILTAANSFADPVVNRNRVRVGSTFANSGGVVHNLAYMVLHPQFNRTTMNNDVAVLRTLTTIVFSPNTVASVYIAGANYALPDNAVVWAVGWGRTSYTGPSSEQLRHVQMWTVNQNTCRLRYAEAGYTVTDNMVCAGWLDVGGRDQCTGDAGGPLMYNNVKVGISSWGQNCGLARYPGVNTRVARYSAWIQANA